MSHLDAIIESIVARHNQAVEEALRENIARYPHARMALLRYPAGLRGKTDAPMTRIVVIEDQPC